MAKRPTPKKRLSNDRSGNRYGAYLRRQWRRLKGQMNSPYSKYAPKKENANKAIEKITKIKA
jgi:ribosomal protein L37AE/L43A